MTDPNAHRGAGNVALFGESRDGTPLGFYVTRVQSRPQIVALIKERCGEVLEQVTPIDPDMEVVCVVEDKLQTPLTLPEGVRVVKRQFIIDCIDQNTLLPFADYAPDRGDGMVRSIPPNTLAAGAYTKAEDEALVDAVQAAKAAGYAENGMKLYKLIAPQFPRHTMQSIRERYLTTLQGDGELKANLLEGGELKANLLEGGELKANLLDGGELKANLLEGGELKVNLLEGGELKANLLDGGELKANLLDGGELKANLLDGGELKVNLLKEGKVRSTLSEEGKVRSSSPKRGAKHISPKRIHSDSVPPTLAVLLPSSPRKLVIEQSGAAAKSEFTPFTPFTPFTQFTQAFTVEETKEGSSDHRPEINSSDNRPKINSPDHRPETSKASVENEKEVQLIRSTIKWMTEQSKQSFEVVLFALYQCNGDVREAVQFITDSTRDIRWECEEDICLIEAKDAKKIDALIMRHGSVEVKNRQAFLKDICS